MMNLWRFGFVILLCFTFQINANSCTINGCEQNSSSDILKENLSLTTELPSCIMAKNYDGLTFSVVLKNNAYQSCSWIFAEENFLDLNRNCVDYNKDGNPIKKENLFTSFVACENRTSNRTEVRNITCIENNEKIYSSIVFKSISLNNIFVSVQCDGKYTKGFHIRVQPCNMTFVQQGNPVYVDSYSHDYNETGSFRCSNNGTLFYSNETFLQDISTTCLATAEWKGQENLQCWKDPTVQLKGNYDWVRKTNLILQCMYNDGFPTGNNSIFYVNNTVKAVLPKGTTFNLTVDRTFNGVPVFCQAQTPFTQKYNETGSSNVHFLNVLFAPYPQQGECLLNYDTNETCEIEFYSNPNATFVSLFLADEDITNSSDFSLNKRGESHSHLFALKITENLKNSFGTYNLTLRTMIQPYLHHVSFKIRPNSPQVISTEATAKTVAPTTEYTQDTTFLIGISVGGVLAISLFITLIVITKRKKQKEKDISDYTNKSCENEVVMNELYVSADILQNERTRPSTGKPQQARKAKGNEVVYGVVNKPKKKPQTLDESSEKEEQINELYASTDMLDNKGTELTTKETQKIGNNINIEVTYGVVNKPKKKSQKNDNKLINEKPESSTKPDTEKKKKAQKKTVNKKNAKNPEGTKPSTEKPQRVANIKDNEVAYGVVSKPTKKPKASAKSSEKEEKLNELYVSADMLESKDNEKLEYSTKPNTEKKKKPQNKVAIKKKENKLEGSKTSSVESQKTADNKDNEVAHGVVNKPKQKQKAKASAEKNVG